VRLLQAGAAAAPGEVGGTAVDALPPGGTSAYVVAAQGAVAVGLGGASHRLDAAAGGYYSVAWLGGAPTVFEDATSKNKAKAMLTVYNLSGVDGVSLTTGDGKVEIVAGVGKGASAHREVNALAVPLAVAVPGGAPVALGEQVLERGGAYSVVVTGSGPALQATWTRATTAPLR
jgi:hypothetical protein